MNLSRNRSLSATVGVCLLALMVLGVISSFVSIYSAVKEIAGQALEYYPGDRVEALVGLALSDSASFDERNRAIYALGQLDDQRALPALRKLRTGNTQPKPWDSSRMIVQYGVEKAIRQIEGRFSLTRWMYRFL